jgi:hypothetical protein
MEALAITASEWILLLSFSLFLTAISNFRVTNNRLDETGYAHLVEEKDDKLWMTE